MFFHYLYQHKESYCRISNLLIVKIWSFKNRSGEYNWITKYRNVKHCSLLIELYLLNINLLNINSLSICNDTNKIMIIILTSTLYDVRIFGYSARTLEVSRAHIYSDIDAVEVAPSALCLPFCPLRDRKFRADERDRFFEPWRYDSNNKSGNSLLSKG